MESLLGVNKKNRVIEKQQYFQSLNGKKLVYMRGNGKYYFPIYMAVFSVGLAGSLFQLAQYGLGNAKKIEPGQDE